MVDKLFDTEYKAANKKYSNAKERLNRLDKIKQDITNDTSSINGINYCMDYVCEDFAKAIRVSNVKSRVDSKLQSLKEPYQTSDGNLNSACDCIDAERALLQRQMNNAESTMSSIKNGSSCGGGGGRW